MTMANERIEINYKYGSCSGAAYRTDENGIRHQVAYLILHMDKDSGYSVFVNTLIKVLEDTRPPRRVSWRCRSYDALEWVDTYILRHRIYRFCQWAALNAAIECDDGIQIIDKTDDTPENTTYFEWSE